MAARSQEVLPGVVSFQREMNTGGVFGLLQGAGGIFLWITVAAVLSIIWIVSKTSQKRATFVLSLSLMLGGGLGNLLDRLLYGAVRDFIKLEFVRWPVFNVADALICIGWAVLVADLFLFEKPASKEPNRKEASGSNPPAK